MQSFNIELRRKRIFHQLRGWKNALWMLACGYGKTCAAERSN
jgi:hypothetical protein